MAGSQNTQSQILLGMDVSIQDNIQNTISELAWLVSSADNTAIVENNPILL